MENKILLEIAIICSLVGILLLIFISEKIETPEKDIVNITKENLEEQVKITGTITKITETPGLYILTIKDSTGEITAILYKSEEISLEKGQVVTIEGSILEYKGQLEIEIDSIKITSAD